MVIVVPPNSVIYAIVLVHALVGGYHGWSHDDAAVPNTLAQSMFIGAVVFVSPLLAVVLLVRGRIHSGIAIFALSMLGALIFGVLVHFALDTPVCVRMCAVSVLKHFVFQRYCLPQWN